MEYSSWEEYVIEDFKFYAKSRDVIVLSNSYHGEFENAKRCGSLLEAIEIAKCSGKEIWICGGERFMRKR